MTIRIGFLGAGFISRTHRFFLRHTPVDHRIVAVHDPDVERARRLAAPREATVVGEDEIFELVDAVFITAWTSEHERLVRAAAERGVAVFCEKPLAVDAPTAAAMAGVVDRAGVVNQVGLVLRALPQFMLAAALIDEQRAGRPMTVVFRDDQFLPVQGHYESSWRIDPRRAGRGTLLEHSIHDVDILGRLVGPIAAVAGAVREVHGHDRIDDLAVARLDFVDGAVASLTSVWHDIVERPSQRHVEVFCERLQVTLDATPDGEITWQYAGDERRRLRGAAVAERCLDRGLGRAAELLEVGDGAMFNPVTGFLQALRDGTPSPLPFTEAVPAHEAVDAIYASADAGGATVPVRSHEERCHS